MTKTKNKEIVNKNYKKRLRIILHIDMNSYFASVEQQARPFLRGKPIGVTGSTKKRTIIAAASVEAKKFSVKTGATLPEARRLCPGIILVAADCTRYEAITRQFLNIFISKTPLVEIFSIDEAFLDISDRVDNFNEAEKLALEIKQEIRDKIGSFVRCSIGIAANKFMAKLASEAKKPDGLTIVLPGEEIAFLDRFKLTEACGIGNRLEKRLHRLGIHSFCQLRAVNQTNLTVLFNSYGLKLYHIARGIDRDPVKPYFMAESIKSVSRSKTLAADTWDKRIIEKMVLAFCQNIGTELRSKHLKAGVIFVWLRFGDFTSCGKGKTIKQPINATTDIFFHARQILACLPLKKSVRKIGVCVGSLVSDSNQLTLADDFAKPLILDQIADRINQKYGRLAVMRSSLVNLGFSGRAPSFGFKRDFELI